MTLPRRTLLKCLALGTATVASADLLLGRHRLANALEVPKLAEMATPSIALLTVEDQSGKAIATGTGFFVSERRLVTNHHVLEGAARVRATLSNGTRIAATGVLASSKAVDLAVLEMDGGPHPPLELGDDSTLRAGDEIVVIGSPRGLSASVTKGIVSAVRKDGIPNVDDEHDSYPTGSWGIQISASISPGSSGSPVLTADGKVIAVAVGSFGLAENLNFGIPVHLLQSMLSGLPDGAIAAPFEVSGGSSLLRNLGISAGVFGALYVAFYASGKLKGRSSKSKDGDPRKMLH